MWSLPVGCLFSVLYFACTVVNCVLITYEIIVLVCHSVDIKSLWRNGLAHWTSNSKVVGSSPTRDDFFLNLNQTADRT